MKRLAPLTPEEEKTILQRQYGAFATLFVLLIPTTILMVNLFNGSIKYIFVIFSIPFLFIGISSVMYQVSILRPRGQKKPSRGTRAVILGAFMVAGGVFQLSLVFIPTLLNVIFGLLSGNFTGFFQPTYDNLPLYDKGQAGLVYQATESSLFTEINIYQNIIAFGSYKAVPLAVSNERVLIVGDIGWDSSVMNNNLISADITTGKIYWQQTVSGEGFVAVDLDRVYVQPESELFGGATGIVAYAINSGEEIWETTFDFGNAIGIDNLTSTESGIHVRTYHKGNSGFYVLDRDTGFVETSLRSGGLIFMIENGTTYEWFGSFIEASGQFNWKTELDNPAYLRDSDVDAPLVAGDLILVKNGYHYSSPVRAIDKNSGVIVWKFDQAVISNVAVGGDVTYVLTENAEMFALDTQTGRILGSLKFTPDFPDNFDFVTTSIYMAADNNIVAIYFENTHQLSIFRFLVQQ